MNKIVLIGYMGSGKSTIGKQIAQRLNWTFYDLDDLIESDEKMTIDVIFKTHGELYFRKKEHEKLMQLIQNEDRFILSLGGGTPCYAGNHLLLQDDNVLSVYLKASVATLVQRLEKEKEKRPVIKDVEDLTAFVGPHVLERTYYYTHAKHQITIDGKSPEKITDEILDLLT